WTILDRAGVAKNKPTGIHPGWDHILGTASRQGNPMAAKEDFTGPGEDYEVGADDVQVYMDRGKVEPAVILHPHDRVRLMTPAGRVPVAIKYGGDKIGYLRTHTSIQPYVPSGTRMRVTMNANIRDKDNVELSPNVRVIASE